MAIAILTQAMLSSLLPRLAGSPKKAYPSASGGAIRGGGAGEVSLAPKAAMTDVPGSLIAFQQRFPDEAACAAYLAAVRWPHSFVCPRCGHTRVWLLQTKT